MVLGNVSESISSFLPKPIYLLEVRLSKLNAGLWSKLVGNQNYQAKLTATTEDGFEDTNYEDREIPGRNREQLASLVISHLNSLITHHLYPIDIKQLKLYTEQTFFPMFERKKQDGWQVWEFARVIGEYCKSKKIDYDHQYDEPRKKVLDIDFDFSPPSGSI
jgi:hypothetical protein|tara:strand:- start:775 stop:1260 length:486 start_codon:yes stop_codon:yes gene_type:complete